MDTLQAIKERYSCRNFKDESIDKEILDKVILAGLQAPSGMNQQPWKIVVITNKALLDEMDEVTMAHFKTMDDQSLYERMMSRGGKVFYNAPCLILVVKKNNKDLDCGIVVENMALASTALGLGNVIVGLAGITMKLKDYSKYIPQDYEFAVGLLVGHANTVNKPHEIDLTKVSYIE